jgi:hypothetical protein
MFERTIRLMFLRFYSTSLKRPWLKGTNSAFADARYRFSVPLAAPFVAIVATLAVACRRVSPSSLSRQAAALLICITLVVAGIGTFIVLGRVFADYLKTPELALQSKQPPSVSEILVHIALWACVVAYCVLMICL